MTEDLAHSLLGGELPLMPHQVDDAHFCAERSVAGNFAQMGSGKTLPTLAALNIVNPDRVLIIAPPIALYMWEQLYNENVYASNLDKCLRIKSSGQVHKTKRKKEITTLIMSYGIATSQKDLIYSWLKQGKNPVIIADESHYLKTMTSKRTQAILGEHNSLIQAAKQMWFLTGTPMTRYADDVFPFLIWANPNKLVKAIGARPSDTMAMLLTKFRNRYCEQGWRKYGRRKSYEVIGNKKERIAELASLLMSGDDGAVAFTRTLKSVADSLPERTESTLEIGLVVADEELKILLGMYKEHLRNPDDETKRITDKPLATLRRLLGESKVNAAVEYIDEQKDLIDDPILVGAWHTDVILATRDELTRRGWKVGVIKGGVSDAERHRVAQEFNEKKIDILIGQITSMGVSLNLQHGSNRIITIEEDVSPSVMEQFYGRLYRMGQKLPVHIDKLYADVSLEKGLLRLAFNKKVDNATLMKGRDNAN